MPKIKAADPDAVVRAHCEEKGVTQTRKAASVIKLPARFDVRDMLEPAELVRLFSVMVTWDDESACLNLQI